MHIGLDPVTGKPANFIGSCIPALKSQEGQTQRERLQASAPMCVSTFLPNGRSGCHLCGLDDPKTCQAVSTPWEDSQLRRARPALEMSTHSPFPRCLLQTILPSPGSSGVITPLHRVAYTHDPTLGSFSITPTAPARTSHQFCSASALVSSTMSPGLSRRKGPMAPGGGGIP